MYTCPTIETERLILRPFREDDLDAYTAMMQTPDVRHWLLVPEGFGREQAWEQMTKWLGQWALRGTGNWALEEKATGAFVGRAGSHRPERADWPGTEIGWTLHPDHWRKGYATEAGAASRDWVFANHNVDEIYSCIRLDNTASQNVARRLGLTEWEERTFKAFPDVPHMIWRLPRA
jgi:RimJ/RimL family protein N-acetyltransferase